MATKIHLTKTTYQGHPACGWNESWPLTEEITEVTCRRCLNLVISVRSLEEMKKLATTI